MPGLYVHIPFCLKKCAYCDFASVVGHGERMESYVSAVLRETALRREECSLTFDTVYFGGGTPTCLPVELLARLVEGIEGCFSILPGAERTVEMNPGTATAPKLWELRKMGFNRLSMGLQAKHLHLLRILGRVHTAEEGEKAFRAARDAGFCNINLDLMLGLPEQTREDLLESVAWVMGLGPEHIALYDLQLEEGTVLHKQVEAGELVLPSEEDGLAMFYAALETLAAGGYRRYEISNFAKPGMESRHNLHYWRNHEYLGLGCAAASRLGSTRWVNTVDLEDYIRSTQSGILPVAENQRLIPEDSAFETLMLGLRLTEGISLAEYAARHDIDLREKFAPLWERFVREGLLLLDNGQVKLTSRGMDVQNAVLVEMM